MTKEATRIKFGYVVVAVVAAEAIIAAFLPEFPFVAAAGIQAGIYTTYVTGRTVTDAVWTRPEKEDAECPQRPL